jgi:hypothetical protein
VEKGEKLGQLHSKYYSLVPRKTTSLPAVHARTVDQNIHQPLQNMFSERCSTTLVFKVFKGWFLKLWSVKEE